MSVPFYRPLRCRIGRHEMALTAGPIMLPDGTVEWERTCSWCGAKEIVVSEEPRRW